jgi:hypothetical protein
MLTEGLAWRAATRARWVPLILLLVACRGSEPAPTQPPVEPLAPQVDQAQAKRLMLRRYRALFKDMHLRDRRDDKYISFPPLDESVFTRVEAAKDAWIVEADPNAGYIIRGRVAKSGDWVELTEVSYTDW